SSSCPSCSRPTPRRRTCRRRCSTGWTARMRATGCARASRRCTKASPATTTSAWCRPSNRISRGRRWVARRYQSPTDARLLCGVDEAGRGPLAGAVFAAAVVLDTSRPRINHLVDSKLLDEGERDKLALRIRERALAWAVASATVEEIDRLN